MTRSLVLEPGRDKGVRVEDDSLRDGGDSSATLQVGEAYTMRCRIRGTDHFNYPYCNLLFSLSGDDQKGIDLTAYEDVQITMRHRSSKPEDVRLYLNHLLDGDVDPDYPVKMNLYTLPVKEGLRTYTVRLDDFYVPFWWICQSQANNGAPEISKVRELIISTGESAEDREVQMDIHRIEFRGKLISSSSLYQGLLYGWLGWIVIMLIIRAYNLKRLSTRLKARSARLRQANRHLGAQARQFREAAATDELTGLLNRNGMKHYVDKATQNLLQEGVPFSVVFLDIDYFKSVNDHHGHDVGDEVLRAFADTLSERCRHSDIPGRWGGEEFLILCPGTDLEGAAKLAESIRSQVERHEFGVERITCSLGVAQANRRAPDVAIKHADMALYDAKKAGRNRVETYRGE